MDNLKESSSTDKLAIIGTIIDKLLDKLPADKIMEICSLEVDWDESEDGETILPTLKVQF